MDRGFELMIPRAKEEEVKDDYDFNIRFTFLGKEFALRFSVNSTKE
jgi:hypothetical protein